MNKRTLLSLCLCVLLTLSAFAPVALAATYTPGTYSATVSAMHGPMTVNVTVSADAITAIEVGEHYETPGVGPRPFEAMANDIIASQSLAVDTVTGATISSYALVRGVSEALNQSGVDVASLEVKAPAHTPEAIELSADVIIVGGGGAGMAAAVSASNEGASVLVVEKAGYVGGNSIVAGGIYNAPEPSLQDYAEAERSTSLETLITDAIAETPISDEHAALMQVVKEEYEAYLATDKTLFDSPHWFALQTWNGGDKLAVLNNVKVLTYGALDALKWVESMDMEFVQAIHHGGGSLYPRTHSAVLPNGTGYIKALTQALAKAPEGQYTQLLNTTATGLIMDGDRVVGVEATGKNGNTYTLTANNGVILSTGGFAGNVELRQEYCEGEKWPDLSKSVPTSNLSTVTGDGIFFARDAGAELVNMDQIQLLPYCNPRTGMVNDIISLGGSTVFINKEGTRFVREDGRRDDMSKGIIAQTDGVCYMVSPLSAETYEVAKSLGGVSLKYYIDSNTPGYFIADSIEGLAEQINVPADALKQSIEDYNGYAASGAADPFERVSYGPAIEGPLYMAIERSPAVHHTMGGVRIDPQTHALRADGTVIDGLFCAGEIVGGIHGGNRLGGNAIVDFTVFGRIAGTNAAKN